MELFKEIMNIIATLVFVKDIKVDNEMRTASFFCPGHAKNLDLLLPLIRKGLIQEETKIKETDLQKIPLKVEEDNKSFWRALLLIRNRNITTLVISADKGQP